MFAVLSWWVIVEMIGLLALPITLRLFRHLPERGYAFARPVGLLLCGYLLWIGGSFGFLSNTRTAILFAMLLVGLASAYVWSREQKGVVSSHHIQPAASRLPKAAQDSAFLHENWRVIIATEAIFAVAFFGWSLVRAYNPEIAATEKPMEIGFLNAILRSERFPPHDPWLSGFAISYYYFGYLLMAMLTKLSGVATSVAFNLAIALLFALTATGSFSIVYNLLATGAGKRVKQGLASIFWALLGPLFVVVIGNLEGVCEVLRTRRLLSPAFMRWLDVEGLAEAPSNGQWVPTDTWWWWRASRVVNDRDLLGGHMEVIDEFPQFSFLLGDMHPHVLALPFVLVVMALALNLLLGAQSWLIPEDEKSEIGKQSRLSRAQSLLSALWQGREFDIILLAFCLGALGFLNTWDLPIHLFVILGAFVIGQHLSRREQGERQRYAHWFSSTLVFAFSVVLPAALLYLPFYLGFQSQAGGALPLLFNVTRVHQYLLMFGLFVFVIASLVVLQLIRAYASTSAEERSGFWRDLFLDMFNLFLWLLAGTVALMVLAMLMVTSTAAGRQFLQGILNDERVKALIGSTGGVAGLLRQALLIRLTNPWTFLLLVILISALLYLILRSLRERALEGEGWKQEAEVWTESPPATLFVYWIAAVAFLLTLAVEFVYLRDSFGTRMNTVFKFYYQAWVMMAIAAAFGSYYILDRGSDSADKVLSRFRQAKGEGRGVGRYVWLVAFALLVAASMVYPALAIPNKTSGFRGQATLDGMAFLQNARADDYAAIQWLQAHAPRMAYIVEAWGGSYSDAAFVSAFTGLPTVLGWDFHEYQWRGNSIESDKRKPDIARIYQDPDVQQVMVLLEKYDVSYVYVGPVEKRKYELSPQAAGRFARFLDRVYEQGEVAIFQR